MDLHTFRGRTSHEALGKVRAAFGDDALILDTRTVSTANGRGEVEVVAARDRGPAAYAVRESAATAAPALSFDDLTRLPGGVPPPPAHRSGRCLSGDDLVAALLASEVRPAIASRLFEEARASGGNDVATALRDRIGRALGATLPPATGKPRVLAFVGPTGAGKTTTAAKLAARLSAALGHRVGLIAADAHRVGAVEQLRTYADLIGVPVRVAGSLAAIDAAIQALAGCEWVIVDTAGRSPREAARDHDLAEFASQRPGIERVLVLAANVREADLDAAVDGFRSVLPSALVFTKIDEATTLGTVINQAVRTGLPVGFLTNGQRVPADLVLGSPAEMTDLILAGRG